MVVELFSIGVGYIIMGDTGEVEFAFPLIPLVDPLILELPLVPL
jgi:hypothetical protein